MDLHGERQRSLPLCARVGCIVAGVIGTGPSVIGSLLGAAAEAGRWSKDRVRVTTAEDVGKRPTEA